MRHQLANAHLRTTRFDERAAVPIFLVFLLLCADPMWDVAFSRKKDMGLVFPDRDAAEEESFSPVALRDIRLPSPGTSSVDLQSDRCTDLWLQLPVAVDNDGSLDKWCFGCR